VFSVVLASGIGGSSEDEEQIPKRSLSHQLCHIPFSSTEFLSKGQIYYRESKNYDEKMHRLNHNLFHHQPAYMIDRGLY